MTATKTTTDDCELPLMIWIRETFINETKGHIFGEGEPYETMYEHSDSGKLYKSLMSEYGKCTGKVYITNKTEDGVPVGWVFRKRMEYEDWNRNSFGDRYYIRSVWVECYASEPVRRTMVTNFRTDKRQAA